MATQQWSCGCEEVDGKLTEKCTQNRPNGELAAHQANVRFSQVCFRAKQAAQKAAEVAEVEVKGKANG